MALILIDKTDKFVPSLLKPIFRTEKFQKQYKSFKRAYKPSFFSDSQNDIIAFKNEYLKRECLLDDDEITSSLNFSDYITNKNSANAFNSNGTTKLRKNDFMWVFQSEVWQHLDFKEKYTVLHWLQQSCNATGNLPNISLIYKYDYGSNTAGGYDISSNELLIDTEIISNGLLVAGAIIHEMEHFKQYTNQANTGLAVQVAKQCGIELRDFSSYSHIEERALIDVPLSGLGWLEQYEALRFKYIVCPIPIAPVIKSEVKDITTFKEYLHNEYYFQSPPEKQAYNKQKDAVIGIMRQFLQPPSRQDFAEVQRVNHAARAINTLTLTPVLKTLDNEQLINLQNAAVQDSYYESYVYDEEAVNHIKMLHDESLHQIYNSVKDKEGGLSRL